MRNYGVTVSDVMDAIRTNRTAIAFWTARVENDNTNDNTTEAEYRISVSDGKRAEIVNSHTDNIRDLRIMLLSIRFPENTFPAFAFGNDFTPVIVADTNDDTNDTTNDDTNDTTNDTIPESDRIAITDAITDNITEADKVSELITA